MGKLDGKVVLVTGASRGIGKEIAMLFAAEGGKVVCAARTVDEGDHPLEGSLNTTVNEIKRAGGEATAVAANISVPEDCEMLVQATKDTYGAVDVLVNNAALTYFVPIKDYRLNRWMRSWAVNFHAPFILSQLVMEDMIPRGSGSIVNISSGAAIGPGRGPYKDVPANSGHTCYGAEKAALERFSQGLAQEIYEYGISVTALSPSQVVPTPGTIFHHLVTGPEDPRGENPKLMADAALILATEPVEKISGRVTYSQQLLAEYGQLDNPQGTGLPGGRVGSGYSQV
jgi:citronellol/citronellal dehydrogenase